MKLTTKDPLETELALNTFFLQTLFFSSARKENVIIPSPIGALTICHNVGVNCKTNADGRGGTHLQSTPQDNVFILWLDYKRKSLVSVDQHSDIFYCWNMHRFSYLCPPTETLTSDFTGRELCDDIVVAISSFSSCVRGLGPQKRRHYFFFLKWTAWAGSERLWWIIGVFKRHLLAETHTMQECSFNDLHGTCWPNFWG